MGLLLALLAAALVAFIPLATANPVEPLRVPGFIGDNGQDKVELSNLD